MHHNQIAKRVKMSERPLVGPHGQLDGMACLGSHESCLLLIMFLDGLKLRPLELMILKLL